MFYSRFAPSPTGDLHIGSVRTALFAYLAAHHANGQFVLRIEDTDRERSTQAATDIILQGLAWLGLNHDQGPYYQSQRNDLYTAAINKLLETKQAYRCYCSTDRLTALRESQMQAKQKPRYDGHCRHHTPENPDAPHVIRFANPQTGEVTWEDLIRGSITISNTELDDLIIQRSDGSPTYNLTVVVDDADMNITHVLRGEDHINNTPRQINLYHALGAELPIFGHMPLILGADGQKLSKRHGAASVLAYRDRGILPAALLNYLVRLGWSHGDQEIFTPAEMVKYFDIQRLSSSPSIFDEEKLLWVNQAHLKALSPEALSEAVQPFFEQAGIDLSQGPDLTHVAVLFQERAKTLCEFVDLARYFYQEFDQYDEKALKKHVKATSYAILTALQTQLANCDDFTAASIHAIMDAVAAQFEVGMGKVGMPFRVAITGGSFSPPIDQTAELIGQKRVLNRLTKILANQPVETQ